LKSYAFATRGEREINLKLKAGFVELRSFVVILLAPSGMRGSPWRAPRAPHWAADDGDKVKVGAATAKDEPSIG
jgi:hypothetical protein